MPIFHLHPGFFSDRERPLLEDAANGLSASAFRYDSGVEAVRLRNSVGELVILPFKGQQIWQAVMHGRDLTMKSMFSEPKDTQAYLASYGAFFLHCGFTTIGPAGDGRPLHGELPVARYDRAHLSIGRDTRGAYIALGGAYQHTVAFTCSYLAEPEVRLYEGSSLFTIALKVTNLAKAPLDYMYLGHINFRPVDNSRLVYSARVSPQTVRARTSIPPHISPNPAYLELLADLAAHPEKHHVLTPGRAYDPEVVFYIDYLGDANGDAHTMQVLPDGSADYVRHSINQLPRSLRWLCRTPDQDALGMAEVATAGVEGYAEEKRLGHLQTLPGGAIWQCCMDVGVLNAREAKAVEMQVKAIVG